MLEAIKFEFPVPEREIEGTHARNPAPRTTRNVIGLVHWLFCISYRHSRTPSSAMECALCNVNVIIGAAQRQNVTVTYLAHPNVRAREPPALPSHSIVSFDSFTLRKELPY